MLLQHHESVCRAGKKRVVIFKVKVTARSEIIKMIYFFWLSSKLLIQKKKSVFTWFDGGASKARMSCEILDCSVQLQGQSHCEGPNFE